LRGEDEVPYCELLAKVLRSGVGFWEEGREEGAADVGGVAVEMGAVWVSFVGRDKDRGKRGYPTSIKTKVSASKTLLPSVPPCGFEASSSTPISAEIR
jgi:hypothetical protein